MRTLVLHIGDHKTGSTSIQHAFVRQQVLIDGIAPFYGVPLNHNHLLPPFKAVLAEPQGQKAQKQLSKLAERMAGAALRDLGLSSKRPSSRGVKIAAACAGRHRTDGRRSGAKSLQRSRRIA